ncbi:MULTISPECIES: hypothetical protein [Streptomyces]|uniref:Uncharacterized protein n=1 Tax=Streptomyces lycii TaxID=2654337 RepID=A0ABQ7FK87_9ACTN|nr:MULTISPECIES: hypothetical protein [Streptomyces]KAF4409105.1 hypothetical protein GCU69_10655 [Streptomyces lycii]PGH47447.1 hypothetical protein CRI70_28480 [Streptomyces sp. Ru87]
MNDQQRPTHVSVQLTDCARQDADAVFSALGTAFPTVVEPSAHGPEAADGRPTVWSTTVDVERAGEITAGASLSGPVVADISGGYQAVEQVRRALKGCYHAEEEGGASGDQEKELRLRLT